MQNQNLIRIFVLSIIGVSLFSCKPEEIILHGNIKGLVTDAESNEPLDSVRIMINPSNDTTFTEGDGIYILKNIPPGEYEMQASKLAYGSISKNVNVDEAKTGEINFALSGFPIPEISVTYLDFGYDLTSLSFTISNNGKGKFNYYSDKSQDWITLNPPSGVVTNETDSITVTINRTGLSEITFKEKIEIFQIVGQDLITDSINVYLNGVIDNDLSYYKVVTIGTQIWMAENLNTGNRIEGGQIQTNNGIVEKWCYNNDSMNCLIYGGLYQWDELMQYNSSDTGLIGTTRGICPAGWHVPTEKEWRTLLNYIGVYGGGKLKETGTEHWSSPNVGATNEYGFTALPGGNLAQHEGEPRLFDHLNERGIWMCSTEFPKNHVYFMYINYNQSDAFLYEEINIKSFGNSVRCIKD